MELKIRDVSPSVVKELDEKAKKMNISRQKYLKELLENHITVNQINDRERMLQDTLNQTAFLMNIVSERLEENTKVLQMILGSDEDEQL